MKYKVLTDHPIAVDSRDTTHPGGTMHDSSRNRKFNQKLYSLYPDKKLRIADLGCAGGGFVRECLDDGHEAIGLEGSDYSLHWDGPGGTAEEKAKRKPGKRAEWANIPDNLFTADITKPFEIVDADSYIPEGESKPWGGSYEVAFFDVITMWEVAEHIPKDGLPQLVTNVLNHLAEGGVWIMSVSTQPGFHHVTVEKKPWWLDFFARHGLQNDDSVVKFFQDDWIRGPSQGAPGSFHLCLKRSS